MTLGVGWEWGTEPAALAPTEVWEVLTGSTREWREGLFLGLRPGRCTYCLCNLGQATLLLLKPLYELGTVVPICGAMT